MSTLSLKKPDEAQLLRATMRECAAELEAALSLKVGVMDSESKAHAINARRIDVMQSVAQRLQEA